MPSIRRILVAVKDPAARSQPAVTKAAQIAKALGAKLELFHAITTPLMAELYGVGEGSAKDLERKASVRVCKRLDVIAERLRGPGAAITVAAEWDYPAYEAIVRRAKRVKADMVVAERHAGRHIAPWFLHLNDWELLRLCPVPVLLTKSSGAYRHPIVLAAVDPTHFAKPAKLDETILSIGTAVARALRGSLHVVHAHPSVLSGTRAIDAFSPQKAAEINTRFAAAAMRQLDRLLQSTKIPRGRRHLNGNPPVEAIQQVARATHSDIVVMGALSRSGLKRWFIGNTAESLLDRLTCDVLIVKPTHFANRVPAARRGARVITLTPAIP
ncbi:MAG: universal stress protein [Gammaproteobacteria bacterium]